MNKNNLKLILSAVALALAIAFHKNIVELSLKAHLSFTLSMILPYVVEFFIIVSILAQVLTRHIRSKSLWLRRAVSLLILIGGCGIAFAFNPIYDGDFSEQHREITVQGETAQIFKKGLTMVSLPQCRFCRERFDELIKVSKIYPNFPIHVLILHQDSTEYKLFNNKSAGRINISLISDSKLLQGLVFNGFPNLYYKSEENSNLILNWKNGEFGAPAWDFVLKQEQL